MGLPKDLKLRKTVWARLLDLMEGSDFSMF